MKNKQLYNNIMLDISKLLKTKLNENLDEDNIIIFVPSFGDCTIKYAFDPDKLGDHYVVLDPNNEWLCDLPYDIDLTDEDNIIDMINDEISQDDDYNNDDLEKYLDLVYDYIDEQLDVQDLNSFGEVMVWLQHDNGFIDFADRYDISDEDLDILVHEYNDKIEDIVRGFFNDGILTEGLFNTMLGTGTSIKTLVQKIKTAVETLKSDKSSKGTIWAKIEPEYFKYDEKQKNIVYTGEIDSYTDIYTNKPIIKGMKLSKQLSDKELKNALNIFQKTTLGQKIFEVSPEFKKMKEEKRKKEEKDPEYQALQLALLVHEYYTSEMWKNLKENRVKNTINDMKKIVDKFKDNSKFIKAYAKEIQNQALKSSKLNSNINHCETVKLVNTEIIGKYLNNVKIKESRYFKYKKPLNEWDDYDDYDEYDDYEEPKYSLVGIDGNAFSVMGYVSQCMRKEHMSREEIENYRKDAMSGDYNNLLVVSQEMIDFLNEQ